MNNESLSLVILKELTDFELEIKKQTDNIDVKTDNNVLTITGFELKISQILAYL